MGLLSTDIAKVKRLSLREVKLPIPERRVEPITPILVERPPTDEEIAYSRFLAINPLLAELVERLDLVSIKTGERIKKVELREDIKPQQKVKKTDTKKQINMSKQKNKTIQITPELEGKFFISVDLKYFYEVSFYKKFTGFYFNETNKKLSISFVGSKGYFNHLEFIAESGETEENLYSIYLEAEKNGFSNRIPREFIEEEEFLSKGFVEFFDTDKGLFLRVIK